MLKVRVVLTEHEARELHYFLKTRADSQALSDAHGKIVSALLDATEKAREKQRQKEARRDG